MNSLRRAARLSVPAVRLSRNAIPTVLLLGYGLAYLGAVAFARSDPTNWTWGIGLWRFLPATPFALALPAAFLLLLAAAATSLRTPLPGDRGVKAASRRSTRDLGPWIAASAGVAFAALFWIARERIHFLGDTKARLEYVQWLSMGGPKGDLLRGHAAPLDFLVSIRIPERLANWASLNPIWVARAIPCLLGAAFVVAAVRASRWLAGGGTARALVFAVLVTQGYVELFAGYAESYGLQITCMLVWFAAALGERERKRAPGWSAVLFAMTVLAHRSSLLLLPAQTWLYLRNRPERGRIWGYVGAMFVAALAVSVLLLDWWSTVGDDVLFLLGGAGKPGLGSYSLFSRLHFSNVLNEMFLLCPVWALGAVLVVCVGRQPKHLGFLLAAAVPFWGLSVTVRSLYHGLGAARDWDAFAPAGLFLALFVAMWAASAARSRPGLRPILGVLVLIGALQASGWLWVNASVPAALARAEAIARGKPELPTVPRTLALETLGSIYRDLGEHERSSRNWLEAAHTSPNARYFWTAGVEAWKAGHPAFARKLFRRAVAQDAGFRRVMRQIASRSAPSPGDSMEAAMRGSLAEYDPR